MEWFKLYNDMFTANDKILEIEANEKQSDTIILIWIKLLSRASALENNGVFEFRSKTVLNNTICAMLNKSANKDRKIVLYALDLFNKYGMITLEDTKLAINNWSKYQVSTDKYELQKQMNRERQSKYRNKKREALAVSEKELNPEITDILKSIKVR